MHEASQHFVLRNRQGIGKAKDVSASTAPPGVHPERDLETGLEPGHGAGVGDDAWNVLGTGARIDAWRRDSPSDLETCPSGMNGAGHRGRQRKTSSEKPHG